MKRLSAVFALVTCVSAVACGSSGSSSPSAPSSTPTPAAPTTTASSTVTSGVFTFTFPAGMLVSDTTLIQNAITAHASFLQTAFGRTITKPSRVIASTTDPGCANQGASAFTGISMTTVCVADVGWTAHNTLNKQKILGHELFLMLGYEMGWLGHPNQDAASAHWIDEGSAEYAAWQAVASEGLISFAAAKSCMVAQANAMVSPSQNLNTMETAQGFGIPGSFQLAMLGMDQLVTPLGLPTLMTYGTAIASGTQWPTAFQNSFGTSTTAFYNQYPTYRASLGAGSDTCGT